MLQRKKIGNFKPKGRQVKIEAIKELYKIIGNSKDLKRDMLIEYLHLIQDANGYISSDLMEALSNEMKLPLVEVWEVASFYDHFDLIKDNETPPPKKSIRVCNSSSCFLNGSSKILNFLTLYFLWTKKKEENGFFENHFAAKMFNYEMRGV